MDVGYAGERRYLSVYYKGVIIMYPNIDMEKTGKRLETMIRGAGYSVRDIQQYLRLTCPQSIYRWFKGKILPSVEHLCALSLLLGVHMEELLVLKKRMVTYCVLSTTDDNSMGRLLAYANAMKIVA